MNKIKYFTVLMLVGLLTLTGCGSGSKLDAKARLEKALTKLAKADSFTAKVSIDGKIEDEKINGNLTFKAAKDDDFYNLYLSIDADVADEEALSISAYLLSSKKKVDLYLGISDEWGHIKFDNDDVEETVNLDLSEYSDGVSEKDIKDAIKEFKKVKAGKTKDGITEIVATIDADDLAQYGLTDDFDIIFLVDKNDNLTGIKVEIPNYEDLDIKLEIKDINDTKVKVPSDVKEDAEEIDEEEFFSTVLGLLMGGMDLDNDLDLDLDDDDDDDDDDTYTSDEIFHDVLLSASIKSCSSGEFKVDFKNYNDELALYDSYYDVKRIEDGELTFTPDAEDSYECKVEVTRPFVIDGKKCSVTDMEYNEGECK